MSASLHNFQQAFTWIKFIVNKLFTYKSTSGQELMKLRVVNEYLQFYCKIKPELVKFNYDTWTSK